MKIVLWRCTILRNSFVLKFALLLLSQAIASQAQVEPKRMRFDFTPLIGYRTSVTFAGEPTIMGQTPHVVLEDSPSYGAAVGFRLDEEDLIEFRWARQNTRIHTENAIVMTSRPTVTFDQFHGDFTHEYIRDDWPKWARPYIIGSAGATHMFGNTMSSFTRFSFGIGGGIKVFPTRHFGFRFQGEWLPIVIDPHVAFVCGPGCIMHLTGQLSSQGEFTMGPLLRF